MIPGFIQGNVAPYQREIEKLKATIAAMDIVLRYRAERIAALKGGAEDPAEAEIDGLRASIRRAYGKIEAQGFPPEAFGWPFINIGHEELPGAIEAVLTALVRQRDELLAEVLKLRKLKEGAAHDSA